MRTDVDYEKAINRWVKLYGSDQKDRWSNPAYSKDYAMGHPGVLLPEPVLEDYARSTVLRTNSLDFRFDEEYNEIFYATDKVTEIAVYGESRFVEYAEDYIRNRVESLLHGSGLVAIIGMRFWYHWAKETEYVKFLRIIGCVVAGPEPVGAVTADNMTDVLLGMSEEEFLERRLSDDIETED